MTLLHAYFHLRNQRAFQRLLEGPIDRGSFSSTAASNSGGKSWNRPSALSLAMSFDVNARDWLGRTVLHLACASTDPSSLEYVKLLLNHPTINVNLYDLESHWTALHRALYSANFPAALLLLQRSETDISLKDLEGYTAFDLYNSTLEGTKPSGNSAELYTWGTNRNAALGLGDGNDRTYPDQVVIQPKDDLLDPKKRTLEARFSPLFVRQISMSRLHSAIVTSEGRGNLRVCGFGSSGRLGVGQHTQYSLKAVAQLTQTIVAVALGQDHTLALTASGEVLSWGLNRFSQLGYVVDLPPSGLGRLDEPIQTLPRRIAALKKEIVRGVAASKMASACWTETEVFTWGTNHGQLGYDKTIQPVQVVPRKVTKVTLPVLAISITDSAMACLLNTGDVVCLWEDRYLKINFPGQAFPSDMQVYRPPQAIKDAKIAKITSCDDTFAALSSNGELFTFSMASSSDVDAKDVTKPQRVWALRKQFSAVRDVALGSDGSIIICTESGHVYVRSRSAKTGQSGSAKTFRFQRVPYIQRVTQVCANNTGAFGALRVDFQPQNIVIHGNTLAQDLAEVQPYLCSPSDPSVPSRYTSQRLQKPQHIPPSTPTLEGEDEGEDVTVQKDITEILRLCGVLEQSKIDRHGSNDHHHLGEVCRVHGADLLVQVQSGVTFPVHRVILAARCSVLLEILSGSGATDDQEGISVRLLLAKQFTGNHTTPRLSFAGCSPMSVLLLLEYLYSDELLALWDRRIFYAIETRLSYLKVKPNQVRLELQKIARILDLPLLTQALELHAKAVPASSISRDIDRLFQNAQLFLVPGSPLKPDVVLHLADKDVFCHSVILRARSAFFSDFFDDEDWTRKRWDATGTLKVDLRHLNWREMQFVLRHVYCGGDEEMFTSLEFVNSLDDTLDFMFEVMAAANELLLDRLVMICSAIILKYTNINNACYILADATYFHAQQLVRSLQEYIIANMDLFLESRMLDDLTPVLVKELSDFARQKQAEKAPVSRTDLLGRQAMEKHSDWLALEDIPEPIVRSSRPMMKKDSPNLLPSTPRKGLRRFSSGTVAPSSSPILSQRTRSIQTREDALTIDDGCILPPPLAPQDGSNFSAAILDIGNDSRLAAVWKGASSAPRVDMKTVMAETLESRNAVPTNRLGANDAGGGGFPKFGPTTGHRDKHKPQLAETNEVFKVGSPGSIRSTSSPWRQPSAQPSTSPANPAEFTSPDARRAPGPISGIARNVSGASNPSITPPRPMQTQPGLGPVFTPSRQPHSKPASDSRHISSGGKAWTQPPIQPVVTSSPPVSRMSFIAIQQLQLDQNSTPAKDKRSLLEIQEEEQALQAEAEFLKWWTAEEERIKLEAEAVSQPRSGQGRGQKKGNTSRVKADSRAPRGPKSERNTQAGKSGGKSRVEYQAAV